jgi:transcriptional regulator with XRE-family HTH domain
MMNLAEIGSKIRDERIELGLSQHALAKLANISRATVNGLERGTLNDLGYSKIQALMTVVGIPLQSLQAPKELVSYSPKQVLAEEILESLINHPTLKALSTKYIWWQKADESLENPLRVIAQIMDIGERDDVRTLEKLIGQIMLREAIIHAQPGWFRPRSWAFWRIMLELEKILPELPKQKGNPPPERAI